MRRAQRAKRRVCGALLLSLLPETHTGNRLIGWLQLQIPCPPKQIIQDFRFRVDPLGRGVQTLAALARGRENGAGCCVMVQQIVGAPSDDRGLRRAHGLPSVSVHAHAFVCADSADDLRRGGGVVDLARIPGPKKNAGANERLLR